MNHVIQNILDQEVEITFSRSSGPGGQSVNTTSSKATLKWPISSSVLDEEKKKRLKIKYKNKINNDGELIINCQVHRSQKQNIDEAKRILKKMIQSIWEKPKKRKKPKINKKAVEDRIKNKRKRSALKKLRSEKF